MGLMVLQAFTVPSTTQALEEGEASEAEPVVQQKKKTGLIGRAVGLATWVLVIAFSAVIILFGTEHFGVRPGVVLTGSMSPAINAGDVVLTQTIGPEEVQVGDVIKYRFGSISIWHRVLEVVSNGPQVAFITKGDANDSIDPRPILPEQLRR